MLQTLTHLSTHKCTHMHTHAHNNTCKQAHSTCCFIPVSTLSVSSFLPSSLKNPQAELPASFGSQAVPPAGREAILELFQDWSSQHPPRSAATQGRAARPLPRTRH